MKAHLGKRQVLRIYLYNDTLYAGEPLWEHLLHEAQKSGLAGATVFKAAAGMGQNASIQAFHLLALEQKIPLVIEMIDTLEKIQSFLATHEATISEGMVTLTECDVTVYRHD